MIFNRYKDNLLDKPDVLGQSCAVCGTYGTDQHHVIQKGMGGVSKDIEQRIPKIKLCRYCHNEAHQKRLHFQWHKGWKYLNTRDQMSDEQAWEMYAKHYSPLKGWENQLKEGSYRVFGAK